MVCEHDGVPLNQHACMHSNHTPSITISKLGSNRFIPLVESVDTGSSSIGIQYDLGSQLSLISSSTLQKLPPDMYTVVKTYHINLLPFTGDGSKVLATEVVLKLNRFKLQLYAIKDELNNISAFSIVMPNQWRACRRHSQLSHSSKIFILFGEDNFHAFPKEQDCNSPRTSLFKSEITNKYLIFGHPISKIFKWKEPVRNIAINKFKTRTPSNSVNPAYHTTPPPTSTGLRGSTPLTHPGQRKYSQQTTQSCPYPKPLFPRILRHQWRKDTPKDDHTALSCKQKPNANRLPGPGANPTPRLSGQNNTAPGHKYQEQQPPRVTKLLTKVYGEERYVKNTAPGLNKDRAAGILALDTGTQLGDAQAKFASPASYNHPSIFTRYALLVRYGFFINNVK